SCESQKVRERRLVDSRIQSWGVAPKLPPLGLLFLPRGRRSPHRGAWGRARPRGRPPDPGCFPVMPRKDGRLPTAREPDSRTLSRDVATAPRRAGTAPIDERLYIMARA